MSYVRGGKTIYTNNERKRYHFRQAQKGAKGKDGKPLSDYARGIHSGMYTSIKNKQKSYVIRKRRKKR